MVAGQAGPYEWLDIRVANSQESSSQALVSRLTEGGLSTPVA